jgi:hypothetical protein
VHSDPSLAPASPNRTDSRGACDTAGRWAVAPQASCPTPGIATSRRPRDRWPRDDALGSDAAPPASGERPGIRDSHATAPPRVVDAGGPCVVHSQPWPSGVRSGGFHGGSNHPCQSPKPGRPRPSGLRGGFHLTTPLAGSAQCEFSVAVPGRVEIHTETLPIDAVRSMRGLAMGPAALVAFGGIARPPATPRGRIDGDATRQDDLRLARTPCEQG